MTSPVALKTSKKAAELLSLFKDRVLHIEDEVLALQALKTLGYYRLTGYAYPLRQTEPVMSGLFKEGAALSLVVELAKFDKQLRLLALNGLETIEGSYSQSIGRIRPRSSYEGLLAGILQS